jgi:hypothetical protein
MKRLLIILLAITSPLFSQTLTYGFSNEFETIKKHDDLGFYNFEGKEYAEVYLRKGHDMIFQIFDEDFKNVKKQETVLLPGDSRYFENEGLFNVKSRFFWFYSTWDRSAETERLFALPFDKASMKFETNEIKLIETRRLDPLQKYRFSYSTDSTKLLVTYRVKPIEKRDKLNKDIIGFNLFDHHMNKLYSAEIEMPYSEYDMDNLAYEVDTRGNIYMLTKVRINNSLDGEVDRETKNGYRYELIRVNQKENILQRIKINLDNKFTNSAILAEDLEHNIVIAGYYSDVKNGQGSNGAYIIRLEYDENNAVKDFRKTYCEFPAETLKAYESARSRRKMDKKDQNGELEASNLVLKNVVFNDDGSVILIGEEYYVITQTNYYYVGNGMSSSYTTRTYYYNDILVLKADKDGKTLWCNKIPKQQSGTTTYDLSYHHHNYEGEDYFFYLDNIKNINLPLTEVPAYYAGRGGSYLTCVKIDKNGKMEKRSVFNIRDEDVAIYPRSFESVANNLIVDRLRADRHESKIFKLEIK